MKLARRIGCVVLLFTLGCGAARSNTTAAFHEEPPRTVAVLTPSASLSSGGPFPHVVEALERRLVERGWKLAAADEAEALLEPSIVNLTYRSSRGRADAVIDARLVRRSDGMLLWKDSGIGTDQFTFEPEEESLADSAIGWVVGGAVDYALEQGGHSFREVMLQQAAVDAALGSLYTFPVPPQD